MSADHFDRGASEIDDAVCGEDSSSDAFTRVREPDPWHCPHRGLIANEVPFRPDLRLRAGIAAELFGFEPRSEGDDCAQNALLANVLYAPVVFYSRDHNHYAELSRARRYFPGFYTYAKMMSAVEALEDAGLIDHDKTAPSPFACLRSRISATPLLLSQIADLSLDFVFKQQEVVILHDANRRLLAYRESDRTFRMRRDVNEHNEFLASLAICVVHPRLHYDAHGFIRVDGRWLDPRRRAYHRVFNCDWTRGGRWFGVFWQGLPKDLRRHLLINGEPVVERDYRACHLRLLYAQAGIELPFHDEDFDPYQIEATERAHLKLAFHVMLNARTETAALKAIARELAGRKIDEPYGRARF